MWRHGTASYKSEDICNYSTARIIFKSLHAIWWPGFCWIYWYLVFCLWLNKDVAIDKKRNMRNISHSHGNKMNLERLITGAWKGWGLIRIWRDCQSSRLSSKSPTDWKCVNFVVSNVSAAKVWDLRIQRWPIRQARLEFYRKRVIVYCWKNAFYAAFSK